MKNMHNFTYEEIKGYYYSAVGNYLASGTDHKNLEIKSNYQKLHFSIRNKLEQLHPSVISMNTYVELWNEVSGAGKTRLVLSKFNIETDLYIAPTVELMEEFRDKLKAKYPKRKLEGIPAKTFEVALLMNISKFKNIYVDEAFTQSIYYFIILIVLAPESNIYLLGDEEQTNYLDEYGRLPANAAIQNYTKRFKKIKYNRYTWRFYKSVCCMLQTICNYYIWPHPDIKTKPDFYETKITTSTFEQRPKADTEIAFSNNARKFLLEMMCAAITSKISQGKSKPIVNVHFTNFDVDVASVRSLQIVALSRASHQLNLVVHDQVTADKVIGAFGPIETISDAYNPCIAPENYYIDPQMRLEEDFYEKSIPPVSIKFDHEILANMLTLTDSIKVRDEEFVLAEPKYNKFTGELERTKADKIQETPDTYLGYDNHQEAAYIPTQNIRTNRKFKLQKYSEIKEKITRTFTATQFGKTYHVSNNRQTLNTSIKRAQGKRKIPRITITRQKKILKRMQRYFMKEEIKFTELNNDLAKALTELYRKRIKKDEMPKNIDGVLDAIHFVAREFQKDITKVKGVGASIRDKVGQPIKAFAQEVNAAFCTYFRAVEDKLVSNLRDNVIYANKYSEEDLNERLNNIKGYSVLSGLDCSEYDGSQNWNTQTLEKEFFNTIWENSSNELYYKLRECFKVINEIYTYLNNGPKPSGGSDTLLGNSALCLILLVNCVEFANFVAAVIKGDDSWVFSRGQPWRKGLITDHCGDFVLMDMKVSTPPIPEFCGNVYVNGVYFYNFPVLAAKILTRNYSDEEDLIAYQMAVKDKLKVYSSAKETIDAVVGCLLNSDSRYGEQFMELIRAFAEIKYTELSRNLIDIEYVNELLQI